MATFGGIYWNGFSWRPLRSSLLLIFGFISLHVCWANFAAAQDRLPAPLGISPLGIRQQRVERMVEELEQKFKSLKLKIQEKEPQRAEQLQNALNRAKELLLEKRMGDVTRLLDGSQYDLAGDSQKALLVDLRELLGILLSGSSGRDEAKQQMELLSQWKKEIQKLTLVQREEKNASDRLAAAQTRQIASPPRPTFSDLSRKQQAIADGASDLAAKMQQSAASAWPSGAVRPGQAGVASAQQAMQRASGKLDAQKAAAASGEQEQAIEELNAAESEIDAALSELHESAELAALADLELLLREMLETQQRLTGQTAAMEKKRLATNGQLTRADRNAIRVIGEDERRMEAISTADGVKEPGLAGKARQAAEILGQGTAAGLATSFAALEEELLAAGKVLADDLRTDADVATKQAQIEARLQNLIAAIKKVQAEKRQAAADAQAEGGNKAAASGSSGKQSQQAAQGGKQGGGSKGVDSDRAARPENAVPHNPWTQLRDKDRDAVYSAIKEKFPGRYQQLIEQYYRSFGDDGDKR